MTRQRMFRVLSTATVLTIVVLAQVGLVLAPSQLGRHPLLVLTLRPTPAFLVLVGNALPAVTAVLIAGVGRTLVDVSYFAVARYGTSPLLDRVGVGRALTRGLSGGTTTGGLLTVSFFWSSTPVVGALGLGTTPLGRFVAVTGAGNLVTSGLYVLFGRRLSDHLVAVTGWVTARGAVVTLGLVAAIAAGSVIALRRAARRETSWGGGSRWRSGPPEPPISGSHRPPRARPARARPPR